MFFVYAFAAGLIFGLGLIISEMVNPPKILGFLDLAGNWDPSLLVVMGGALAVGIMAFAVAGRRTATLIGTPIHMPTARGIDRRLVLGSIGFGVGWGLVGLCPGPAVVALGTGHVKAFLFVVAMLGGMAVFELLERRGAKAKPAKAHKPAAPAHKDVPVAPAAPAPEVAPNAHAQHKPLHHGKRPVPSGRPAHVHKGKH
jgi:uncharacterized membrane protein YedE/YeeE